MVSTLYVPRSSSDEFKPFNRPITILSDFDGTICMQDTGHVLVDSFGCGPEYRKQIDQDISSGARSFREASEDMWSTSKISPDEASVLLKDKSESDSAFTNFSDFINERNISFTVVSAGSKPILRSVSDVFIGEEKSSKIDIIANEAVVAEDGSSWKPVWIHDTELGHDKSKSVTDFKKQFAQENSQVEPFTVFIGDGVSDLAAAKKADILFARKGLALEEYCIANRIPYIPYESFADIQEELMPFVESNSNHQPAKSSSSKFATRKPFSGWYIDDEPIRPSLLRSKSDFAEENDIKNASSDRAMLSNY